MFKARAIATIRFSGKMRRQLVSTKTLSYKNRHQIKETLEKCAQLANFGRT